MKYTYKVESFCLGKWHQIIEASRGYCMGYLDAASGWAPRSALRVVRSDGMVVADYPENENVSIGQVAGFPTAEQFERAGNRALERARLIRERKKADDERRGRA